MSFAVVGVRHPLQMVICDSALVWFPACPPESASRLHVPFATTYIMLIESFVVPERLMSTVTYPGGLVQLAQ